MLNHITLMGRLVRDPERRYTQDGIAATSFTLAVERDYAQQGQERQTDFINCVAWKGLAEAIFKYCKKGQLIVVAGRLIIRSWTDKDGNKRKAAEVSIQSMQFTGSIGKQQNDKQANVPETFADNAFADFEDDDEELPF